MINPMEPFILIQFFLILEENLQKDHKDNADKYKGSFSDHDLPNSLEAKLQYYIFRLCGHHCISNMLMSPYRCSRSPVSYYLPKIEQGDFQLNQHP